MVGAFDQRLLTFLDTVHATTSASGQALQRQYPRTTLKRWQREHEIIYFPNIRYTALGLAHIHVIGPTDVRLPFSVEEAWMRSSRGQRAFYSHLLVPVELLPQVLPLVAAHGTVLVTSDPHQHNAGLRTSIDADGRALHHARPTLPVQTSVHVTIDPFVVLVAIGSWGRRRSAAAIWHDVYAHLGDRVWRYLPRGTRRWPHNGKTYVRQALDTLSRHGLVPQHIIRYQPLSDTQVEVLAVLRNVSDAPSVLCETYPATKSHVLRAVGDLAMVKAVWGHAWLIEQPRAPPQYPYDCFDPVSCTWRMP